MGSMLTRIYGEVSPGRETGLHAFDLEANGVSSPAEIDALIKKLNELRVEMINSLDEGGREIRNEYEFTGRIV